MGISASKRVRHSLSSSTAFTAACDSAYDVSLSLAQHAFSGIKPYQLLSASHRLHHSLLLLPTATNHNSVPLITKWVPSPPDQRQVDRAFKCIITSRSRRSEGEAEELVLGKEEFRNFSLELFTDAVVCGARNEILRKIPIGAAGITGIGLVMRPRREVIGAAIGVYAIGVATAAYISLCG